MSFDILVTGSTGFVGGEIAMTLEDRGKTILRSVRGDKGSAKPGFIKLDLRSSNVDSDKLNGVKVVIHCASAVHNSEVDESSIFTINYEGTKTLVDAAIKAGVQHFVFLSSVAVYGLNHSDHSVADDSVINPQTPYAKSKLKAEKMIVDKCDASGMKYTILRLPLVFGKRAPGNFGKLVKLSLSGTPLPFGGVHNKRTMVYSKNLADFIDKRCLTGCHDNQILVFGDGIVLSTAKIIEGVRKSLFKPVRNIRINIYLLKLILTVLGARKISNQLLGDLIFEPSLEISSSNWLPKYNAKQALELSTKSD
jgi:nucleoside-diphosphate-sugar epimerase